MMENNILDDESSLHDEKRISITEEIDSSGKGFIEKTIDFHDNYLAKVVSSRYDNIANSFNIMDIWAPNNGRSVLGSEALGRAKHELKLFGGYMLYNRKQELEEMQRMGISTAIDLDVVKRYRFKLSSVYDNYLVTDISIMDEIWCLCHIKSFATGDRAKSYERSKITRKKFLFTSWYIEELANCVMVNGKIEDVEAKRGKKGKVID